MTLTFTVTVTVGDTEDPQVVREDIEFLLEDEFEAVDVKRVKQ